MGTTPKPPAAAASWARDAGVPVIADLDDMYPGVEALLANIDYLITSRDIPGPLDRRTRFDAKRCPKFRDDMAAG